MMMTRTALGIVAAAGIFVAACNQPPATTTSTPMNTGTGTSAGTSAGSMSGTSGGEVALNMRDGMWMDSVGGTWMDTSGGVWMGGRRGMAMGLQAADIAMMTNANVVAHLSAGDSLEVVLSQAGVGRAQNSAVRQFAQRMVDEHTAHMQMGKQKAMQGGITPMPSPADTADVAMASQMMMRLSNQQAGAMYDRQLMRSEVMMHQHMLHDLHATQPRTSGAARELVDQTIPVVTQHLKDAQALWKQVGGGMTGTR
jgi:putative membrane protein